MNSAANMRTPASSMAIAADRSPISMSLFFSDRFWNRSISFSRRRSAVHRPRQFQQLGADGKARPPRGRGIDLETDLVALKIKIDDYALPGESGRVSDRQDAG